MKNKKIRYVSLEPGAFISDVSFQLMTCEERGAYFTIILHLYDNDGYLPMNKVLLNSWCNCQNFENVFEKIKHKFLIKDGKISHKRVLAELRRARQISQLQREKGVRGMKSRWGNDSTDNTSAIAQLSHSNNTAITKRSEEKGSEDKLNEDKRSEYDRSQNSESRIQNADGRNLRSVGSQNFSQTGSSPPHASQATGTIKTDLTMKIFNLHDELCKIFPQRTPSDSSSIRNLVNWVRDRIRLGLFEEKIIGDILAIARDSTKGKSRKPIAVFYARLKKELNYRSGG